MVPWQMAPARAMRSRTCAEVIQPCLQNEAISLAFSSPEAAFLLVTWSAKRCFKHGASL